MALQDQELGQEDSPPPRFPSGGLHPFESS